MTDDRMLSDILTSLFAVAGWNLERAHAFVTAFRKVAPGPIEGLQSLSDEAIAKTLVTAGFDRGAKVLHIMTERTSALLRFLSMEKQSALREAVASKDTFAITQILGGVKGIGPKVLESFFLLQGLKT